MTQHKFIGELLLDRGLITEAELKIALSKQSVMNKRLGDILVDLGFIKHDVLEEALTHARSAIISPSLEDELLHLFPVSFLKRHLIFPISREDGVLRVATSDPQRLDIRDDIQFMVDDNVEFILTSEEEIREAFETYFGDMSEESVVESIVETPTFSLDEFSGEEETPINRLVNALIVESVYRRASDIHLEPLRGRFRMRYRIDGVLQELAGPPLHLAAPVTSRIKLLAKMDIAEKRLPQDGQISFAFQDKEVELRVSVVPSHFGESLTLRILDKSQGILDLDELGLTDKDRRIFRDVLRLPHGLILMTGPTGSGKTTTLYSLLNEINNVDQKIITVEDPVEYQLKGINQVQVNAKIGLSFAQSLRAILRQAPNVIMIGEIRDSETAGTAIQAALTGHLVLSTLHTNDALGAVVRLFDMGVQPYKVAAALQVSVAQRLVRRICKNCQVSHMPSVNEVKYLHLDSSESFVKGEGCEHCLGTGYYGRAGIFETMLIDESLQNMIFENVSTSEIRSHLKQKKASGLRIDGLYKARMGWTTLEEVLRVTPLDAENLGKD